MRNVLTLIAALLTGPVLAQEGRIPSHCIGLAQGPEQLWQANFREAVPGDQVRITYIDHSMFLLQSGGLSAVTDYAGYLGADFVPTVVTMNNGHSTHWTARPDPDIPFVLEGWASEGRAADHYLDLDWMLVRNVPTDTRGNLGWRPDGNSIFVFEMAGLCIAHFGHLHHEPTDEDYARLGRVDVAMIAVDGGLTLDIPTVLRVMDRVRASVVIPMHWFGTHTLQGFLAGMEGDFAIRFEESGALMLDRAGLPDRPTVVVLRPGLLSD